MTAEPHARRVALPGSDGEMAYLDLGPAGRPVDVVFVHANGFNGRTYRSVLAPLADLRILAVDLRGHGRSTLPTVIEGRRGWTEFRDDLLAFLELTTDGAVVLAGHSMGGTTSLLTAVDRPERVRALALFDPVLLQPSVLKGRAGGGGPPETNSRLAEGAMKRRVAFKDRAEALSAYRGRGAFRTWSEEQIIDYMIDGLIEAPGGGVVLACARDWEASNFRTHNCDPWAALAHVRRPVRILRAETDSTAHIEVDPELFDRPNIHLETIPGSTHFLPLERPELARAALRDLSG